MMRQATQSAEQSVGIIMLKPVQYKGSRQGEII